jgi:hypothetical protein
MAGLDISQGTEAKWVPYNFLMASPVMALFNMCQIGLQNSGVRRLRIHI